MRFRIAKQLFMSKSSVKSSEPYSLTGSTIQVGRKKTQGSKRLKKYVPLFAVQREGGKHLIAKIGRGLRVHWVDLALMHGRRSNEFIEIH